MTEDIKIPTVHRPQDTLRLRLTTQAEARVNRAHGIVKFLEYIVRIIERAVSQDVDLARFENAKASQPSIKPVDQTNLSLQVSHGQAACNFQALRVVADAEIFITKLPRRSRHGLHRIAAITRGCMRVQVTANVLVTHQVGKAAVLGLPDLIPAFAKFGGNIGQPESGVEDCFRRE